MTIRQYLIRNVNVLNLILLAVAAFVFIYVLDPILQESTAVAIPSAREESAPPAVSAKNVEGKQLTTADYAVIGDKNLFHPDRIIPPEKKKVDAAKEKAKPELVLHGTMITEQTKLAYIEDKKAPASSQGRGARQITLKEGDQIAGYKLTQVTDKLIVLTNGGEQVTLYLDELKERKTETTMTAKPVGAPTAQQAPPRAAVSQQRPRTERATPPSAVQPRSSVQTVRTASSRESQAATLPPPPTIPILPLPPAKTN